MAFLSVKNIVKKFDTQTALNNVNVDIEKGELVSILGPSGCGKTTLLRIIAGLETPDMGQVFIDGKDCTQLPPSKRNFGIVFQSYVWIEPAEASVKRGAERTGQGGTGNGGSL